MLPFKFVLKEPDYKVCDVFYERIEPTTVGKEEFLKSLYYQLWFPGYFGFNWDALYDCLRDFSWMPYYKICIFHSVVPKLDKDDLRIYLEILRDSAYSFVGRNDHELEIIFFEKDRKTIEDILSQDTKPQLNG